MMKLASQRLIWLGLCATSVARAGVAIGTPAVGVAPARTDALEARDRSVDQAAASAQESALKRLRQILAKYVGTAQEPDLLSRIAEAEQQDAAIKFRIAHGRAHRTGGKVDLKDFRTSMKASIGFLDRLITKYPDYSELAEAIYLRAKGYDELEDKEAARRDYQRLVKNHADSTHAMSAHMRLAEYAIDENHHDVAVAHLEEIEKHPQDPQFPFAIYKLAWSHYNLGHFRRAIGYLERHVALFPATTEVGASDSALRETSLMDMALFRYEAFERKADGYTAALDAYGEFRKVEPGALLGKMLSRYARMLRAGNFRDELNAWKHLVLDKEIKRPEGLEVVTVEFDDRVDGKAYAKLGENAGDYVRIYGEAPEIRKTDAFDKARALILATAEELQKLTIKNKGATEVASLAQALSGLYLAFENMTEASDIRIPRSRYNLAEAYFQIGNFEKAVEHYRWIVTNTKPSKDFDVNEAALRAVGARYESLRKRGLVAGALSVRSAKGAEPKTMDPALKEWLGWLDIELARKSDKNDKTLENYAFEADRALYAAGYVPTAMERLMAFARKRSASEFAPAAMALVLDTRIQDQDWNTIFELARDVKDTSAWKGSPLAARLTTLERDAYVKLIEADMAAGAFEAARDKSKTCLRRYENTERESDCRLNGARALVKLGRDDEASKEFGELVKRAPASGAATTALVSRAALAEKRRDFAVAARDYASAVTQSPDAALSLRALTLAWMGGDAPLATQLAGSESSCLGASGEYRAFCEKIRGVDGLRQNTPVAFSDDAVNRSLPATRALYELGRLGTRGDGLSVDDRFQGLETLASMWTKLDPLVEIEGLRRLPNVVRVEMASLRAWVNAESIQKAEKSALKKRIKRVERFEDLATKLVALPWVSNRVEVLNETAEVYTDLANALRQVPAPKGLKGDDLDAYARILSELATPFEEKAQDIRGRAFELALKSRVETDVFERVADAFFRDNPSQAKKLAASRDAFRKIPADVDAKDQFSNFPAGAAAATWYKEWTVAVAATQWARAAWILKDAETAKALSADQVKLLRGVTLVKAGARSEGLALFDEARIRLSPPAVVANVGGAR